MGTTCHKVTWFNENTSYLMSHDGRKKICLTAKLNVLYFRSLNIFYSVPIFLLFWYLKKKKNFLTERTGKTPARLFIFTKASSQLHSLIASSKLKPKNKICFTNRNYFIFHSWIMTYSKGNFKSNMFGGRCTLSTNLVFGLSRNATIFTCVNILQFNMTKV